MNESIVQLLKLSDIIGIYFLLPFLLITAEIVWRKKKNKKVSRCEITVRWLHFCVIGCGGIVAGITQAFFPQFTATLLQVPSESFIVIRELGYAAIGTGVISILSLKFPVWRLPTAIARAIFILLAILIHLTRISIVNFAEILSIVTDTWIVAVAVFIIIKDKKILEKSKITN